MSMAPILPFDHLLGMGAAVEYRLGAYGRLAAGFIVVCALAGVSKAQQVALLPESATKAFLRMHVVSGSSLGGYWQPSESELAGLERNLPRIAAMRSEGPLVGVQIEQPAKDNRQYVAFLLNGKRTIYVNALCGSVGPSWNSRLVNVSDGGACAWHVLYDVASATFSHLTTNGRA